MSKNGVPNIGAQSSLLATLIPLLFSYLMLLSLIVSLMILVIVANLLRRQVDYFC